jgi:guanosine-3',5'-bis(diphosphate) 3'-pyrophosphohydrolase
LIIHTHDCAHVTSSHKSSENYLDVTWGKDISRTFEAGIKVTTANKQGVLARVAAEIAKADSNIDDIAMESEDDYMHMRFILQINNRHHLAQVMRSLRRLKEVAKISRTRG